nr:sex comb on midleg-like protein 4 [Salvelinus alpinus]
MVTNPRSYIIKQVDMGGHGYNPRSYIIKQVDMVTNPRSYIIKQVDMVTNPRSYIIKQVDMVTNPRSYIIKQVDMGTNPRSYIIKQVDMGTNPRSYIIKQWTWVLTRALSTLVYPAVCIYINKHVNMGPNLDRKKLQQLPDHFGPDRPSVVLQQAVQGCIDSAFQQKAVFTLLTQGYGGEKISATFDGKQHLLSLPVVNSMGYVLRFLKKLCRSLHCENLFSDQPIPQHNNASYQSEAETSMPEEYLLDPSDKRYSMDPGDSAFSAISSSYSSKPSYGFRSSQQFPNGSSPLGMCRQTSSPNTFMEGNRIAYNPSQDSQESKPPPSKDPSTWSVEEVVWFIRDADPQSLGPHADVFRKHEIDGNALLLLKSDMMMKYLGLKLGPALKLCYHIDKLKQNKF